MKLFFSALCVNELMCIINLVNPFQSLVVIIEIILQEQSCEAKRLTNIVV